MKYPVLLPKIFNYPFTYESNLELRSGDFVKVPFGKSKVTGVIWDEFEKNTKKSFKIKKILKKLETSPLKGNMIKFLNWFSKSACLLGRLFPALLYINSCEDPARLIGSEVVDAAELSLIDGSLRSPLLSLESVGRPNTS